MALVKVGFDPAPSSKLKREELASIENTTSQTLGAASQALLKAGEYEMRSAERRSQQSQQSVESLSTFSNTKLKNSLEVEDVKLQTETNKQQAIANGAGQTGKALSLLGDSILKFAAVDQERENFEVQQKIKQNIAQQQANEREAERRRQEAEKAKVEGQDINMAAAYDELAQFSQNWKASDGFKQLGVNEYRRQYRAIIDKYDITGDQKLELNKFANSEPNSFVDDTLKRAQQEQDRIRGSVSDTHVATWLTRATGPLATLTNDSGDANTAIGKINELHSDLWNDNTISEEDKFAVSAALQKRALEAVTANANLSERLKRDFNSTSEYHKQEKDLNAQVRAGTLSQEMLMQRKQELRVALGVPEGVRDVDPWASQQAAAEFTRNQNTLDAAAQQRVIDENSKRTLSDDLTGYYAYQLLNVPGMTESLEANPVTSKDPRFIKAREVKNLYNKVKKDNAELAQKNLEIQNEKAKLQKADVKYFIGLAQRGQKSVGQQVITQLLKEKGLWGEETTEEQINALTPAELQQLKDSAMEVQTSLDREIGLNNAKMGENLEQLRRYGLAERDPIKMTQYMSKRREAFNSQLEAVEQGTQAAQRNQVPPPSLGVQSPSRAGGSNAQPASQARAKTVALYEVADARAGNNNMRGQRSGTGPAYNAGKTYLPFRAGTKGIAFTGAVGEQRKTHKHAGQDISVAAGTDLVFYTGGTVLKSGLDGSYGNAITIKDDNGMLHRFAHMQNGSQQFQAGQRVNPGDVVGKVGGTGRGGAQQYGVHLHWEIRKAYSDNPGDGRHYGRTGIVNPMSWMQQQVVNGSVSRPPLGNTSGQVVETGVPTYLIPKGAVHFGGGMYALNGRIGQVGPTYNKPTPQPTVSNPIRNGYSSTNKKDYGPNNPTANYGYAVLDEDPQFKKAIAQMCDRLNIPAQWLVDVMAYETGGTFSTSIPNRAGSGATGLIQFMPDTARGLGTTTAQLASMTRLQQLKYVEKYMSVNKQRLTSPKAVLSHIFAGQYAPDPETNTAGDGNIGLQQYAGKLGNAVGRRYYDANGRRGRITAQVHSGANHDSCRTCVALQLSGSPLMAHIAQA